MKEVKSKSRPKPRRRGAPWYAYILFLAFSVFSVWGVLNHYIANTGHYYAVYINGLEIGMLEGEEDLERIVRALEEEAAGFYGGAVKPVETIQLHPVHRPFAEPDGERVRSQLRHALTYQKEARMITVDGKDILPVSCLNQVNTVIDLLAGEYVPEGDHISLQKVEMSEKVESRRYFCFPEEIREAETVAATLLRGTDRREIYLVSRGDSLWKIAQEHDLSVDDLKEANPQINGELLQIGDELSLIVPEPLVNVVTVERVVVEENIPFGREYTYDSSMWRTQTRVAEEGEFGRREVVYEVTRENGMEISEEKISEEIVKEPRNEIVAKGTANIPARGTGNFIWPVQGGGRMTSGYGWRSGGFHAGIDIASRAGTSILAADSGVVVYEGWDGAYGRSIVIYHGHYYTRYAHHSANLVSRGDAVSKGQVIARMGSSGRSTGPHLHFEVRTAGIHGPTVNPLNFFSP